MYVINFNVDLEVVQIFDCNDVKRYWYNGCQTGDVGLFLVLI